MRVPMHELRTAIKDYSIVDLVDHQLLNGKWANIKDGSVKILEEDFAEYIGVKHAICVSNGTAALITALAAIGLRPGDEVLVPSFTFFADIEAILFHGAKPVFVDIDPNTYTMDTVQADGILDKDQGRDRIKCILPVHLFGLPCNMEGLPRRIHNFDVEPAYYRDIPIIEDCSQAHGAEYQGKKVGSIGDIGCFSLYPTKNMYCGGEGGLITTNDDTLAEKMRSYINHGYKDGKHQTLGYNFRMSEVQAAIGRYSLRELDENNKKRRMNANEYYARLRDLKRDGTIILPKGAFGAAGDIYSVFHCFTIQVQSPEALGTYLAGYGIETTRFYETPAHAQPAYRNSSQSERFSFIQGCRGCNKAAVPCSNLGRTLPWLCRECYYKTLLPNTDRVKSRVLQLPIAPHLTTAQIDFVIEKVKEFYQ